MIKENYEKLQKTIEFLQKRMTIQPKVAIVLGSGLGGLTKSMEVIDEIPYKEIPNFPVSTVKGHKGALMFGKINNVDVVVLSGRFHYYEGYPMETVTYPEMVFAGLGIKTLILSNAAGGMNPTFQVGDIMVIRDHINFFGTNPLLGPNDDTLGPRFPNMSEVYSKRLRKLAHQKAKENDIHLQEGVYIGVTGPCFETPAEYKAYYLLGADAVGMSTVPEAIIGAYRGMEIFAFSVITDLGVVGQIMEATHEEVLAAAKTAEPKMIKLVYEMMPEI